MSKINIQFQGDFSHIADVPVPVEVVNSDMEMIAEATIPLGSPKQITVNAPGLYLVRAALPSGERVSSSVTLPPSTPADPDPSATATLSAGDRSPRESSAWAYTIQGIERAAEGPAYLPSSRLTHGITRALENTPDIKIDLQGLYCNSGASDGAFHVQAASDIASSLPLPPEDPRVVLRFQVHCPSLAGTTTQWWPYYQALNIQSGPEVIHSLLAIPPLSQTEILLVRSEEGSAAAPVRPLVQGGDPRTDALLSYLTQGAFADARAIGGISNEVIQEILAQKRQDPASALVSAYYMLRAGTITHPERVKNLADWFTLLPDGAVQYGWCLLRQAAPDYNLARTYFLAATQRGIPIYSYGIRLLYDGLNLFAERNSEDTEVANAFRAVRRLAAAADWRSAVTSLINATPNNEGAYVIDG